MKKFFNKGLELRNQYKFKSKDELREQITKKDYAKIFFHVIFNVYFQFLSEIKKQIIENESFEKQNYQIILVEITEMFKKINECNTLNNAIKLYNEKLIDSPLGEYHFSIFSHVFSICSAENLFIKKKSLLIWQNPLLLIKEMLTDYKIIKCNENLLLSSAIYFLKALYCSQNKEVLEVFNLFDSEYDYEKGLFLIKNMEMETETLIKEIIDFLPEEIIVCGKLTMTLGATLVGGLIVIKQEYLLHKLDESHIDLINKMEDSERLKELVENYGLGKEIIRLALIIFHECFHKKRILVLSKGRYYKYSPRYDNLEKKLDEAGQYAEEHIFGCSMANKIQSINDNDARYLLQPNNWKNNEKLRQIISQISIETNKTGNSCNFSDYPCCFHPGSYDRFDPKKK